jgi:hypothetical protein
MIESSDDAESFIKIQLVEDIPYICEIVGENSDATSIANNLLSNVKKYINQTNFISLSNTDSLDDSAVSLSLQIKTYKYKETDSSINVHIEVNFSIANTEKGELYSQNYKYNTARSSNSAKQGLPLRSEILSEASNYLAKKFIKDISPIKTKKLVELKSLPDELTYTIKYAKGGNFKAAIKAMEAYTKDKDSSYYYNLAVYYEGLASTEDDMNLFSKASDNYEKAMALGGHDDEVIVNGKMKFDKFYDIIKKVAKQTEANQKANENSQYNY